MEFRFAFYMVKLRAIKVTDFSSDRKMAVNVVSFATIVYCCRFLTNKAESALCDRTKNGWEGDYRAKLQNTRPLWSA